MNNTVLYNLPVQTEIPEVISVPRAEMCSNALLFYDAFRGLCRMRIAYAQNQINFLERETEPDQMFPLSLADAEKIEKFWSKVKAYWEGKLELSYKWEKDYFGRT